LIGIAEGAARAVAAGTAPAAAVARILRLDSIAFVPFENCRLKICRSTSITLRRAIADFW
jgi:hypothetical protein